MTLKKLNFIIFELENKKDVTLLLNQLDFINEEAVCKDFEAGFLKGLICRKENNETLKGIIFFSYGYTTWQHRIIEIKKVLFKSNEEEKCLIFECFIEYLAKLAVKNECKQINFNIEQNKKENEGLIECMEKLEAFCLDDWFIFEMDPKDMEILINYKYSKPIGSGFKFVKIENVSQMKEYASSIHGLIREIAIFQKLEHEFETSIENLIKDYDSSTFQTGRIYESMVVLNSENQVIGHCIYNKSYDIEKGRGCFMDEIYIQEEYRKYGLGTEFLRQVLKDCLNNLGLRFIYWLVLEWNQPAIKFYSKFNGKNLTLTNGLKQYRFDTNTILKISNS
jgi:RimJ/RimL family protein N-acetyltransferase